ncbi:MAG: dihydrolipoyl dehydrogenase family protein, partial [Thermodesulfovibrionales bacterium]
SAIPSVPFNGSSIISSTEALALNEIPERLLIIGAGYIGCEFGCLYSALGSQVALVDILPRVVHTEDDAISLLLHRELKKRKVSVHLGVTVDRVEAKGNALRAFLSSGQELPADKVLVAVGRDLNSSALGLEDAGVTIGGKGQILVNGQMRTNVPHIYAVGDVTGIMLLAHVASRQGICAAENIMGAKREVDYASVPSAIFTSPEIASVGLREREAKERGLNYLTGEFPFRALGRAQAMGDLSGIAKVVAERDTNRILGAHIIGPHASDLIQEFALAMRTGLTIRDIAETIHAHPTLSEAPAEACDAVQGTAIHLLGIKGI